MAPATAKREKNKKIKKPKKITPARTRVAKFSSDEDGKVAKFYSEDKREDFHRSPPKLLLLILVLIPVVVCTTEDLSPRYSCLLSGKIQALGPLV